MGDFVRKRVLEREFDVRKVPDLVEELRSLETGQQAAVDSPLMLELVAQTCATHLKPGDKVLDLGCGAGNFTLRVLQDVVMNDVPVGWSQDLLDASPDRFEPVEIKGTLSYQVCSDTTCFPPGTLPLRVALKLRPKDEIRVRPELRRPEAR